MAKLLDVSRSYTLHQRHGKTAAGAEAAAGVILRCASSNATTGDRFRRVAGPACRADVNVSARRSSAQDQRASD